MAKKYLYGNLNQDTVRPNYGGASTDSLTIHVDNDNMIISGEVKWDAALGELAHKAYPGDKGARNYAKILELSALMEEEIATAQKNRSDLTSIVNGIEKSFNALTAELTTAVKNEAEVRSVADAELLSRCVDEATRALEAENELLKLLKQEITTREKLDNDLLTRVDKLSGLSVESIEEIQSYVDEEQKRAQKAEAELAKSIEAETARAIMAEESLVNHFDIATNTLQKEIRDTEEALASETTARILSNKLIEDVVQNESARAQEVEAELYTSISNINTQITELRVLIDNIPKSDNPVVDKSVEEIEEEIAEIEKTLTTISTSFTSQLKSLNDSITINNSKTADELQEIKNSVSFNTELISKLSGKLKDINKQLSNLDVALRTTQSLIAAETNERNNAISSVTRNIQSLDSKIASTDVAVSDLSTDVDTRFIKVTDSIQVVDSAVKTLNTAVVELYRNDQLSQDEFIQLNEQLKTVYKNISEISAAVTVENERATTAEKELGNQLKEVVELSSVQAQELKSVIDTLVILTSRVTNIELNESTQADINVETAEKIRSLESLLQAQVENLQKELQRNASQDDELVNRITEVETALADIPTVLRSVDEQLVNIRTLLVSFDASIENHEERITTLEEDQKQTATRISALTDGVENAVEFIQTELATHEQALTKHDVSTHQHDVDIEALQASIEFLNRTDSEIKDSIQKVDAERQSDSSLHQAHYAELVSRIEQEIKRALDADKELFSDTERNSGRITSLQLELTDVISNYVDELRAADTQLAEKVDVEHTLAEEAHVKLQSTINKVEEESLQRDDAIQDQIEVILNKKDSVPLIENEGELPEVYTQQGDKTFTIPVEKAVLADVVVRRDSTGNILLSTDTDKFTVHSAVSKLFVENIVKELREEISSISFDFIDGGNAPIE